MTTGTQDWSAWLTSPAVLGGYAYIVVLHAFASMLIALLVWSSLSAHHRRPLPWAPLLLFSVPFFMPLVGAFGIAAAAVALRTQRHRSESLWRSMGVPSLPFRPAERPPSPMFHDGGLQDVIYLANDPDQRLAALLTTRRMDGQSPVSILKLALRDPADDVRLLAYSMLDQQESRINQRIERLLIELAARKEGPEQAVLHGSLAHWYWELAYLGLAQGSVLNHVLAQAATHVETSLLNAPDPELQLLGGRIALEQGNVKKARNYFTLAERGGMSPDKLLPFLAETAFMEGDYAQIPRLLASMPPGTLARPPFTHLTRYWL